MKIFIKKNGGFIRASFKKGEGFTPSLKIGISAFRANSIKMFLCKIKNKFNRYNNLNLRGRKICNANFSAGFSLIELIVTLGIIIMISTLILVNYPNLSEMHSVDRAARLVSIKIRDAEIRAMSIKEDPTSPSARFPAYGVHFDLSKPKDVALFVDLNCSAGASSNCKYESAAGDTIFETKIIPTSAAIKQICGNLKSDPFNKNCNLISADIVFLRPTPSIFIKGTDSLGSYDFSDIEVIVGELRTNNKKMIGATQGGQIFIESY